MSILLMHNLWFLKLFGRFLYFATNYKTGGYIFQENFVNKNKLYSVETLGEEGGRSEMECLARLYKIVPQQT